MVGRWWRIPVVGSMVAAFGLAVPAAAQTKKLGTFGGWAIGIVQDKGRFVRCVADTTGGAQNEGLRLSFADDATRHLIVSAPGAATGAKEFDVEGAGGGGREAARVGEDVETGGRSGELGGEGRDIPRGDDGDVVDGLRAGRIVVEDDEGLARGGCGGGVGREDIGGPDGWERGEGGALGAWDGIRHR